VPILAGGYYPKELKEVSGKWIEHYNGERLHQVREIKIDE
jgi:hypothetical protein